MSKKNIYIPIKSICVIWMLFLTPIIFSCKQNVNDEKKPVITVSILPQKFLVEQIAGNTFDVDVLIPPGASPVTYEPLPKQLTQLKKSRVYFQIGHLVFEDSWTNKIKTVNPGLDVVDLSEDINLIEDDHGHGHEHHHEHVNPHTWMSPTLMKLMAKKIEEKLAKIQPGQSEFFKQNLNLFSERIDSLHLELKNAFENSLNKSFLIYHPALTYFAKDYGLKELSLEKEGKEPSPKELAELVDIAKKENIKTILVQSQFDQSNAATLAKEIDAKIVEIDPLSENWFREIENLKNVLIQK